MEESAREPDRSSLEFRFRDLICHPVTTQFSAEGGISSGIHAHGRLNIRLAKDEFEYPSQDVCLNDFVGTAWNIWGAMDLGQKENPRGLYHYFLTGELDWPALVFVVDTIVGVYADKHEGLQGPVCVTVEQLQAEICRFETELIAAAAADLGLSHESDFKLIYNFPCETFWWEGYGISREFLQREYPGRRK